MLCRAAKADATSLRPAIHARISSTKHGRITNFATSSIRSKGFKPTLGSRSSFAGFRGSRKGLSSEPGATETGPTSPTGSFAVLVDSFSVPIAQSTERECPKLQVAGESPAGDTISSGCWSTAECGRAKAETTVRLRPLAPLSGDVAHQQSARLTCERRRGQHASSPPLLRA